MPLTKMQISSNPHRERAALPWDDDARRSKGEGSARRLLTKGLSCAVFTEVASSPSARSRARGVQSLGVQSR